MTDEYRQVAIGKIKPYDRNPRRNDASVDAVANSIRDFGFRAPIICGEECNTEYNGQEHAVPVGWSSFSMHYPGGLGQKRHACKRCTSAIGNGRLPVTEYFQSKMAGEPQICPNPTSTVVSLGQPDKMTCRKSDTEQEY